MGAISLLSRPLAEDERNARIYRGEILVWRQLTAVIELRERLAAHIHGHLGAVPEQAHRRMGETELAQAVQALRARVGDDDGMQELVRAMFLAAGLDTAANYDDGLKVRAQSPQSDRGLRGTAALPAHRDTWGSNVMAQVNWWAPVFPTTPQRTIMLFPTWFERPVANDSGDWDFAELVQRLKRDYQTDYPLLPTATDPPPAEDGLAISIEPGDLMAFSGAQLHASVPNTSELTRFSFEIRTVNGDDATAGRGAANIDGRAPRTTWQMFRRLSDGEKLGRMA